MHRRPLSDYFLLLITTVFSVTCINLGFWQIRRLAQRKALNARVVARLNDPPVPVTAMPRDSASLHYRRALVRGAYDYAHQVKLVDRTRDGAPGVNIITPVRIARNDTAVLVNRGWVYAPDGVAVDLSKWREGDSIDAVGYARPFGTRLSGNAALADKANAYRWLDRNALRKSIPYPVFAFAVVLQGDGVRRAGVPPRVPPPPLDEGPHRSYAIQWFAFALTAIVGTFFFLRVAAPARRGYRTDDNRPNETGSASQ